MLWKRRSLRIIRRFLKENLQSKKCIIPSSCERRNRERAWSQAKGIPGSGIPERTFVKNFYKRYYTSLPSPLLLFIAFFTLHRSPLYEHLELAMLGHVYILRPCQGKFHQATCLHWNCSNILVHCKTQWDGEKQHEDSLNTNKGHAWPYPQKVKQPYLELS